MSEDIVEKSIQCLANAKLNDTTYEVARDIVLQELQQKENIIKEVYAKANDTNITSLDLRDYILKNLRGDE